MHGPDRDVEQLLITGFSRLPVDPATVTRATQSIMLKAEKARCTGKRRFFPVITNQRLYAMAATLLLFCGFGYVLLYRNAERADYSSKREIAVVAKNKPRIELLSYVSDSGDRSALRLSSDSDNRIVADSHTQLLLGIGCRTRTICREGAVITVGRADYYRTTVTLLQGAIAVDIGPGGTDTVSIVTASGSITHLGTRFTVSSDPVKGVSVEVYDGSVHIQDIEGRNFYIHAGEGWKNGSEGHVVALNETMVGENAMDAVFTNNLLEQKLQWNLDNESSLEIPETTTCTFGRNRASGNVVTTSSFTVDSIVQMVGILVDHDEYTAIDSIISHLEDRSTIDTLGKMIVAAAERKIMYLQFLKASRLFELVGKNGQFTIRQRENAAVRNFILRKNHLKITREELFLAIKEYRQRFPEGIFGDDMAAEAITVLLATRKTDEAIIEMRRFLRRYPMSPQNEYYRYVYASTLRENPGRSSEALGEFEKYLTFFPQGKYREDALYRIIQLNGALKNPEAIEHYRHIYLEQFPQGRWVGEVSTVSVGVHDR